jgi:uncharacterized membrane protein
VNMKLPIHTLHTVAAGCWLGGIVFTSTVVSPALQALYPIEAERVGVRSAIGRHYAPVAGVNLAALLLLAPLDGRRLGFGRRFAAEALLLVGLCGVAASHGAYFGPRLARLAVLEQAATDAGTTRTLAAQRHTLQGRSLQLSRLNALMSLMVAILASNDTNHQG